MTPTPEQMRKLKHATGWGEADFDGNFCLAPGLRRHRYGYDLDCEKMCSSGLMERVSGDRHIYFVTNAGLALVLAEWATLREFTVLTDVYPHDSRISIEWSWTTHVMAKTRSAARFKIVETIQDAWCISFIKAVRHIKSVRKVRP